MTAGGRMSGMSPAPRPGAAQRLNQKYRPQFFCGEEHRAMRRIITVIPPPQTFRDRVVAGRLR